MRNVALLLTILSCLACLHPKPASANDFPEARFTGEPYVRFLNAKATEIYDTIRAESPGMSQDTFTLDANSHTVTIGGREADARLEALWIGPPDVKPGDNRGRVLDLGAATVEAPMAFKTVADKRTLIGAHGKGSATVAFQIDRAGTYAFWGKACGPNARSDSFFVAVDGGDSFIWDVPTNRAGKCSWRRVAPRGAGYYSAYNFLLAFAAASPHGARRTDAEFRKTALALCHAALKRRATIREKSQQLWFIHDLEAVHLWQLDPNAPPAEVDALLKGVRRYLDKCHAMATSREGWRDNTPNIQIQAACLLTIGADMWRKLEPDTSAEWTATAKACLDRAWKYKEPGGPFGYSYDSGADAGYFANDAKYLGRIYRLTGNKRVEAALRDMVTFAHNTTAYGHPISLSSPWWKHTFHIYNRRNLGNVAEVLLTLTKDPVLARVVQLNRGRRTTPPYPANSDYVLAWYNTLEPDITCPVAPIVDKTWLSPIENGPALRYGPLNVAMPWRPWCESTCGATWANPDDVVSEVCSVILTAITSAPGKRRAKAHFPVAYSITPRLDPEPDARAVVRGPDFIASAITFRPALGGPALPQFADEKNESPWQRTDIYYADQNGVAGFLQLRALRDNNSPRIVLWTHASDNLKIEGSTVRTPGLAVHLEDKYSGHLTNLGTTWGFAAGLYPLNLVEAPIAESLGDGFRKGQTFRATMAIDADSEGSGLRVGTYQESDGLYSIEILRDGQHYADLFANLSEKSVTIWQVESGEVNPSASPDVHTLVSLPSHSLTVLHASKDKKRP